MNQMQPGWILQDCMRHKVAELGLENAVHVIVRRAESVVWDALCPELGSARWECVYTLLDKNVDLAIILPIKSFAATLQSQYGFVATAG